MAFLQVNVSSWPVHRCSVCHDERWPRVCGCDPAVVQDGHRWVVSIFPIFINGLRCDRLWPRYWEFVFREEWLSYASPRSRWPA